MVRRYSKSKDRWLTDNCDRACDKCGERMIGIMEISGYRTPRKMCEGCGGKSVYDKGGAVLV